MGGTLSFPLPFTKMTGSGNDFIIVDNRDLGIDTGDCRELVRSACRRKFSVGADGMIFLEDDPDVDFRWRFFNADGSEAEMCGNGARCVARFARVKKIVQNDVLAFRTLAGVIEAAVIGRRVKVKMTAPEGLERDVTLTVRGRRLTMDCINTGVPHAVIFMETEKALEGADVFDLGRAVRRHAWFEPAGTNTNFAYVRGPQAVIVRTYERGVEDETLACGTGAIASVLAAASRGLVSSPVEVFTRSGETLTVHFQHSGSRFHDVFLEGDARIVYEGRLWDETLS